MIIYIYSDLGHTLVFQKLWKCKKRNLVSYKFLNSWTIIVEHLHASVICVRVVYFADLWQHQWMITDTHQWCVLCHFYYSSISVLLLLTLCMCQWYVSMMWAGLDGNDPHVLRTLPQSHIQHRGWRVQLQHGSGIHVGRGYHLLHQFCPDPHEVSQTFLISVVLIIRPSFQLSHTICLCAVLIISFVLILMKGVKRYLPHELSHTFLMSFVLIITFVLIFMKWVRPSSSVESHLH